MDTLRMIRERHSVRAYLDRPIEQAKLGLLQAEIGRVNEAGGLTVKYVGAGKAFDGLMLKMTGWKNCPGALVLAGRPTADLRERCGYWGEHLVLFCQSLGLNTCWAGMARRGGFDLNLGAGEEYVVSVGVGYGANQGRSHRSKTPEQVAKIPPDAPAWFREGIDCALLAPTAVNQQRFHFELDGKGGVVATVLGGGGNLARIDLGIACYHFEAATGIRPVMA